MVQRMIRMFLVIKNDGLSIVINLRKLLVCSVLLLHDSALMFISELEIMQPDLFELDIDKQVELLQNKAKEVAASIVSQSQSQQNNLITSIIG